MEPWLLSAITAVIGGLVSAIGFLFRENKKLTADVFECQSDRVGLRSDLLSLTALVEQKSRLTGVQGLEAVVVVNVNTGLVVEWNPGATLLFHRTEREMLGKEVRRIMPDRYWQIHAEAMNRFKVNSLQTPGRGPILGHALTKDGTEIPIEIRLSAWRDDGVAMIAASITRRSDVEPNGDHFSISKLAQT